MNKQGGYIEAIVAVIFVAAFVGLLIFLGIELSKSCANGACEGSNSPVAASNPPDTKPATRVECDWSGFMGEQIIADMSTEGYRFTGRTNTFFCENALAFELKEQQ